MDDQVDSKEDSTCEYCGDSLCGGDCQVHPGTMISVVGLIGLLLIALTIWISAKI